MPDEFAHIELELLLIRMFGYSNLPPSPPTLCQRIRDWWRGM